MTYPLNFNFNNGFAPEMSGLSSFGVTSPTMSAGGIFDNTNVNMPFVPFDTFNASMAIEQAEMQNEFFKLLLAIMSNMQINHTPEPFVLENFRPFDYNSYGNNGNKISQLSPQMQEKTMQLLDFAKSQGMNVSIVSGYRTKEEQKELQRTREGYAAKNSLHCQGKAIDINIAGGSDKDYEKLADYAKSIGMRWGGDFSKVKERWHFDLGWA